MAEQPERIIPLAEVRQLMGGISPATWWRMCRDGLAPPVIPIAGRRRGVRESDYRRWLAERSRRTAA